MLSSRQLKRAKKLRKNQTKAEKIIWRMVRNKRMLGLKFKRQHVFGNYILDFFCESKKLVIEIDGAHHADKKQQKYDLRRTHYLEKHGLKVIRLWNDNVIKHSHMVYWYIVEALEKR